jgi:class 3 adenylate cyclase
VVQQAVGVDTGSLFLARTGIRGANDLVWVGRAANHAAKLCSLRSGSYASWITKTVYDSMNSSAKNSSDGCPIWEEAVWNAMEGMTVYRSSWTWAI